MLPISKPSDKRFHRFVNLISRYKALKANLLFSIEHLFRVVNVSTSASQAYFIEPSAFNQKAFISDAQFGQQLVYDRYLERGNTLSDSVATRPVRVMMLGLRGFPNVQGGVESHVEHLAPLLLKHGCEVEVIARSPYQDPNIGRVWQGVKFSNLWAPKSKGAEALVHTFFGVLYAAVVRPDILHIHAIGPALMTPLARLLGLNVVITHHGPDYNRQKWGRIAKAILLMGEWVGMRFSNGRIVISNTIRELVLHKHTMHSELIVNGVLLPEIHQNYSILAEYGLEPKRYILLVSRLVPEKRHLDLVEAFNQCGAAGYKLVFVGSSDHPDAYVESVKKAAADNPNIVLTGFQTGLSLATLYSQAALFVLPSSHEGLSISLLEALSYGLPVLASDIPANLEVGLQDHCYYPLGNVDILAKRIKEKIESDMDSDAKSRIRQWVANRYDWSRIAEKTAREYRSVLSKH